VLIIINEGLKIIHKTSDDFDER